MTLSINATKFSGRVLKAAITKYLAHRSAKKHERQREKADVIPHGKQKVKELIGQNAGVANVDIKDEDLKGFERIARKYGVDYAVKRVKGQNKYLVFFKSRQVHFQRVVIIVILQVGLHHAGRVLAVQLMIHIGLKASERKIEPVIKQTLSKNTR